MPTARVGSKLLMHVVLSDDQRFLESGEWMGLQQPCSRQTNEFDWTYCCSLALKMIFAAPEPLVKALINSDWRSCAVEMVFLGAMLCVPAGCMSIRASREPRAYNPSTAPLFWT